MGPSQDTHIFEQDAMKRASSIAALSALAILAAACSKDDVTITPPKDDGAPRIVMFNVDAEPALSAPGGVVLKSWTGMNKGRPIAIVRITTNFFAAHRAQCTKDSVNLQPGGDYLICPVDGTRYRTESGTVATQPPSGGATELRHVAVLFDTTSRSITISE